MDIEGSFKSFAISFLNCGSLHYKSLYTCRTTLNYSPASLTGGPEKQGGSVTSCDVVDVNQLSRMHFCSPSCMKSFLSVSPFCCSEHSAFTSNPKLQTHAKGTFPLGESDLHGDIANKYGVNRVNATFADKFRFYVHCVFNLNEPSQTNVQ